MRIHDEEVFGPVVCINAFSDLKEALAQVNNSRFGLQAAIFTEHQPSIELCFSNLEVGGVILNRATTFRTDQMPYGGVKDSGFGREGVKYAMMDYLDGKVLVF
jgi:glyceraldehyde-3-phosphate dehydrogenase (NADP+)